MTKFLWKFGTQQKKVHNTALFLQNLNLQRVRSDMSEYGIICFHKNSSERFSELIYNWSRCNYKTL